MFESECSRLGHFKVAMSRPDMQSVDGRQQGVGGLLPAANDECGVVP